MFDLRELKLMFLDPTDLIINNINKFLYSNKAIKFILLTELQNYFHIIQKVLKMEKTISNLGEFTSISISC